MIAEPLSLNLPKNEFETECVFGDEELANRLHTRYALIYSTIIGERLFHTVETICSQAIPIRSVDYLFLPTIERL